MSPLTLIKNLFDGPVDEVAQSFYYAPTHTWTSTGNAPGLSVAEMYEVYDQMRSLNATPAERRAD